MTSGIFDVVIKRDLRFFWWWHVLDGYRSVASGNSLTEARARRAAARAILSYVPPESTKTRFEEWTEHDAESLL